MEMSNRMSDDLWPGEPCSESLDHRFYHSDLEGLPSVPLNTAESNWSEEACDLFNIDVLSAGKYSDDSLSGAQCADSPPDGIVSHVRWPSPGPVQEHQGPAGGVSSDRHEPGKSVQLCFVEPRPSEEKRLRKHDVLEEQEEAEAEDKEEEETQERTEGDAGFASLGLQEFHSRQNPSRPNVASVQRAKVYCGTAVRGEENHVQQVLRSEDGWRCPKAQRKRLKRQSVLDGWLSSN